MSDSAVRLFVPDRPQTARTLRGRLETRRAELYKHLISAQDWPDFTQRRGVIRGLDEALSHCAEIESEDEN